MATKTNPLHAVEREHNTEVLLIKNIKREKMHFLKQCGLLILIDQLIIKAEKCKLPSQYRKFAKMGQHLLTKYGHCKILIHSCRKIEVFIEDMIDQAKKISKQHHQSCQLKPCALSLLASVKDLNRILNQEDPASIYLSLQKAYEKPGLFHAGYLISLKKFYSSWLEFTKKIYKERLFTMLKENS